MNHRARHRLHRRIASSALDGREPAAPGRREDGEQQDMAIGARLTAYRVVQESLTNAVKYAAGRRTLVRLAHTPDWTDVEVTTAGTPGGAPASSALRDGGPDISGGRGLAGLRERVEMLGASSPSWASATASRRWSWRIARAWRATEQIAAVDPRQVRVGEHVAHRRRVTSP